MFRGVRFLLVWILPLTVFCGCTTHAKRWADLQRSFQQGDIESASRLADQLAEKNRKNAVLVKLDQSIVKLAQNRPDQAERILREVRDQFASQDPLQHLGKAASLVSDDQARPFQPDEYEQLFVLIFLAISNLLQNGDDAFAYANQLTALQAEIENRIRESRRGLEQSDNGSGLPPNQGGEAPGEEAGVVPFRQIALAPFIAGVLHEETHRDYDSAELYFERAARFQPGFQEAQRGVLRTRDGRHSLPGNGVLYVFAAVGRGPRKVEKEEIPTSQALLIADRMLSALGDHTLPPTLSPIRTSRVEVLPGSLRNIRVMVDGRVVGQTETVTDLGQIAKQQDLASHPAEMARAIVRRVVKKSAVYASKDALGTERNSWADLLINAGGVLWEATESADTRCWRLLPEKIQVLRVELPVGSHPVQLLPIGDRSEESNQSQVEIRDGANTYLFANFPTGRRSGEILVSSRGR
ncbi:MAG: hypothetical protein VX768_04770 [Planctomycetota bacterium]|nr:hypothetical protein [Planctomycetota bacterium]